MIRQILVTEDNLRNVCIHSWPPIYQMISEFNESMHLVIKHKPDRCLAELQASFHCCFQQYERNLVLALCIQNEQQHSHSSPFKWLLACCLTDLISQLEVLIGNDSNYHSSWLGTRVNLADMKQTWGILKDICRAMSVHRKMVCSPLSTPHSHAKIGRDMFSLRNILKSTNFTS